jgi:predicted ATPase
MMRPKNSQRRACPATILVSIDRSAMIHKLILKNFKRIKEQEFLFNRFDLLVGGNNSGKSTVLQALAIWQYCVDQFRLSPRSRGSRGIQVVLPNFTALPLPEFNLLWSDRMAQTGKSYVYIEIDVHWRDERFQEHHCCVQLRYQSQQSIFAIPSGDWNTFAELERLPSFPRIVYVPPFSGLEPHERWMDDGNVRQQIGKAQPGAVLRNLLYRVIDRQDVAVENNRDWEEICARIKDWFGIELDAPQYEKGVSTEILAAYKSGKKRFDVISGGSGFHQILTLMAFIYGYPQASTLLFDEPDAHLHVNLQRKIIHYFKGVGGKQFLIATHSEEFVKGVEVSSVLSMLSGVPRRIQSSHETLHALSEVDNIDVVRTQQSPFILYLEGEDDGRLLSAWAETLGFLEVYEQFYPYVLGGPTKKEMQKRADLHFKALRQLQPSVSRAILLDYDADEEAINPPPSNPMLNEWKRKNIDNYLLVPDAWKRAIDQHFGASPAYPSLFSQPYHELIDRFFAGQNLTLPPSGHWKALQADIFKLVDGKKLLFERSDSLFEQIKAIGKDKLVINREAVSKAMLASEIHQDVDVFFSNLKRIVETASS